MRFPDLSLAQIHEVTAEDEKGYSDNQKRESETVQKRMHLEIQDPACGENEPGHERKKRSGKTCEGCRRLPSQRAASRSLFLHD